MSSEIHARIKSDKSVATLIIQPGFDQSLLTPMTLIAIATSAGVLVSPDVEQVIEQFIAEHVPGPDDIEVVIATSTLPKNGANGWIEWSDGFDPDCSEQFEDSDISSTDHYLGKNYIEVSNGDVLGIVHEPTDGVDGIDVLGGCLKAVPGKSSPVKFHSSVRLGPDRKIFSTSDGVVSLRNDLLEIVQLLVIPGCVDFSSGHIDFAGSITVRDAIRTGFNVKVDGDVQVGGLIEASEIICGGDLTAKQGMAGKGRGGIQIGGDVIATYLEEVCGTIGGDLKIQNSLIGCDLTIHGDVNSESGVIRGGTLNISGVIKVRSLGSESSPKTQIYLGQVPKLQQSMGDAEVQVQESTRALKIYQSEYNKLIASQSLTNAEKERVTELMFEISDLESLICTASKAFDRAKHAVESSRKLNVQVACCIYPGVEFVIGEKIIIFESPIAGPLSVFWDDNGQVLYRVGSGEARPIETIAKLSSRLVGN